MFLMSYHCDPRHELEQICKTKKWEDFVNVKLVQDSYTILRNDIVQHTGKVDNWIRCYTVCVIVKCRSPTVGKFIFAWRHNSA